MKKNNKNDKTQTIPVIVGVGASAGGFEALHEFISELEPDTEAAYVIAQHLDPSQPTMLLDLLQRYTKLPIKMVQNGMSPQPNTIYICPPDNNITLQENLFKLSTPEYRMFPKPSINIFFKSLAQSNESGTVGIIFSGSGSDGAEGIRAIKNAGGITIVQDEKSAKYSSMPRASIDTGCVDIISTPKLIGQEIGKYIKTPALLSEHQEIPKGLDSMFDILLDKYNIDFGEYKIGTIQRRIERRMAVRKVDNIEDYINVLTTSKQEAELLYKDFLVIVTSFFRDKEAFNALKIELEKLVKESQKEQIRVWVAGCATGEEAYTISMILHRVLSDLGIKKQIQIFATDISEDAIQKARNAVFTYEEIASIDKYYLEKFFLKQDHHYEIKKYIRDSIIFSRHDLIKDPSFLNIDLITCRNLLIYFNSSLQKRIFAVFHHSLTQSGLLFLGKSESISVLPELFVPISSRWKIFKKDPAISYSAYQSLIYLPRKYPSKIVTLQGQSNSIKNDPKVTAKAISKENVLKLALSHAVQNNLFNDFLIVDRNNNITYTTGNVQQYLQFPDGNFNNDIFSFLKDEIKLDIRILISKARKTPTAFNQRVKVGGKENATIKYVNIIATSIEDNEYITGGVAIAFMDSSDIIDMNDMQSEMNSSYLRELEIELNYTKEQLQTTVEELETSNEELQSTNEELQSTNEELQSTNEELETSNEELQSTNEELTTVNDELELRAGELKIANNDLMNVFNTINSQMILLDNHLRVKRFTKLARNLFVIDSSNYGDVITSIPTKFDFGNIRQDLLSVLDGEKEKQFFINASGGITYKVNYLRYLSDDNKIVGVVILINDITELENEKERFALAIDGSSDGLWDWNIQKNEVFFSPRWKNMLGFKDNEIKNEFKEWEQLVHPEDLHYVKEKIEEYFQHSEDLFSVTFRMRSKNGEWVWIRSRGKVQLDTDKKPIRFVGFHTDITKEIMYQQELEKEVNEKITKIRQQDEQILLQAKNASLGEMIGNIAHQWRQPLSVVSTIASTINFKYDKQVELSQEEIVDDMNQILEQVMYLSDTIDIFRNFLNSSQAQMVIAIEEVISNSLAIVSSNLKNNFIEIKNEVDFSRSTKRMLKAGELSQVIINILNNAKDAILDRKINDPWIKIKLNNEDDKVILIIEDNGGGIMDNVIDHIFEPYFTTKHKSKGTGLGLYMSYKIVHESLKGTIRAENTKVGAKFIIEF